MRRVGACMTCAPLLPYQVGEQPARLFGAWNCPQCGRSIALDFGDESEQGREALRTLARCYAYHEKVPMDGFTITYNGEPVMEQPACQCGPEPCGHTQLLLQVATPQRPEAQGG